VKVRRSYEIYSGGKLLGIEHADSAQEALFGYLHAHGCWDEEIVKMRPDVFVWAGAAFTAQLAASHLEIVGRDPGARAS
jgi:hypothetical protein